MSFLSASLRLVPVAGVVSLAIAATPAGAVVPVVAPGSGLTAPGGLAVDPAGALWVADGILGVCKVVDGAPVRDGRLCAPEAERTTGPGSPAGIAFRTSLTGTSLYVADGASGGSGVWRIPLDATTGVLGAPERIVAAGDSRPNALSVAPDGAVHYTVKRDDLVRRISDPEACGPCVPSILTSPGTAVTGLAHLGTSLFLSSESGMLAVRDLAAPQGAAPAPGFPVGPYGAVATDASSRVYGSTPDKVLVVEGTDVARGYATGFAGITALTVAPDGTLFVADDPSRAAGGVDTIGQGRIFASPLHAANVPEASIVSAPATTVADGAVTFGLAGPDGAELQCAVDGGAFTTCGTAPTATFQTTLAEGTHTFRVRAVLGTTQGPEATWVVTVDSTPPTATIDTTQTTYDSTTVEIPFSANESPITWECVVDGTPWRACESPRRLTGLSEGEHVVRVRATDAAGNVGAPVEHRFTVKLPPPPVDPPKADEAGGRGPSETPSEAPPATGIEPLTGSSLDSVPCAAVSPPTASPRFVAGRGRKVVVSTNVPRFARYAKITLRHRHGSTRGELIALAARRVVDAQGRRTSMTLTLSPKANERLRSGRYRLAVSFGTCTTVVGAVRLAVRAGR